jgi:hypothetical protein
MIPGIYDPAVLAVLLPAVCLAILIYRDLPVFLVLAVVVP